MAPFGHVLIGLLAEAFGPGPAVVLCAGAGLISLGGIWILATRLRPVPEDAEA